jgi:hypothetical protein
MINTGLMLSLIIDEFNSFKSAKTVREKITAVSFMAIWIGSIFVLSVGFYILAKELNQVLITIKI